MSMTSQSQAPARRQHLELSSATASSSVSSKSSSSVPFRTMVRPGVELASVLRALQRTAPPRAPALSASLPSSDREYAGRDSKLAPAGLSISGFGNVGRFTSARLDCPNLGRNP